MHYENITSTSALSETRLAGTSKLEEVGGGCAFFWIGKSEEEPRLSDVGFAIKSDLVKSLSAFPKEYVITLALDLKNNSFATLVSCYDPTGQRKTCRRPGNRRPLQSAALSHFRCSS